MIDRREQLSTSDATLACVLNLRPQNQIDHTLSLQNKYRSGS